MHLESLSPLNLAVDPFTLGDEGDVVTPDSKMLLNPNKTPMLVDEFKFNIAGTTFEPGGSVYDLASVWIKLWLGATPLTNDFIPLLSFAPIYFGYPATGLGRWGDSTLTWHLARPMYVPPDVQVGVSFKRVIPFLGVWDPDFDNKWGFAINGRSMLSDLSVPKKIAVPWACATTLLPRTENDTELPYTSKDSDIVNPFDVPLHVDYFTGFNVRTEPEITSGTSLTTIMAQMTLSNGMVMLRDPTPFSLLFPPDRPMLRMRALLQPKEFVSVMLDVPTPTDPENAGYSTIGMTGWRELDTPRGAQ